MNRAKGKETRHRKKLLSKWKTGVSFAALAAAVAVFVILIQVEENILSRYEKGEIYVAAGVIPRGQMITEENYLQYFAVEEMDKRLIPETALTDPLRMQGLAAVYDVEAGTLLTKGMFEEWNTILGKMTEPVIAGFRAEDIYQVTGGTLRAGDRVHIYTVKDGKAMLAWEYVYIQQVFDASGVNISNTDKSTAAQRVNVFMDKKDVEAFYTGMAEGSLRVVKCVTGI